MTLWSFTSQLKAAWCAKTSISQHCRFPFVRKQWRFQAVCLTRAKFSLFVFREAINATRETLTSQSLEAKSLRNKQPALFLLRASSYVRTSQIYWELSGTVKTVRLCFGCDVTLQMLLLFSCEKWKHLGTMLSTFTFFASCGKKVANAAH